MGPPMEYAIQLPSGEKRGLEVHAPLLTTSRSSSPSVEMT